MADNRDFVQGFMNEGGSPVYVEDKKLSEISTKTAIASEGVMLKGTDGAYYEIDKASLSEVIRAELGAILADNSKNNGTSVGKVPTLNSSGNALGASSVADLASVLGGINHTMNYLGMINNLDSLDETGYFYAIGSDAGLGISIVYYSDNAVNKKYRFQLKTNDGGTILKYRVMDNGTWINWKTISAT